MAYSKPAKPIPVEVDSKNGGNRPNFIMFMPDQLRYDTLGCTQDSSGTGTKPSPIRTPHIDAFRARGTLFTECYVQASVCAQSRCSMFTGTYPHVSGHRSLNNLIKPWEPNVLRSLKENGYHVACLAPRGDMFAPTVTEMSVNEYGFLETPDCLPGFAKEPAPAPDQGTEEEIWGRLFYKGLRTPDKSSDYDDAVIRSALAWLECPPSDKPWVLFMPLLFPHCPFQVEEPYFSMYDRATVGSVVSRPEAKTGYEPRYMQTIRERYGTKRATDEMWREIKATYYGMIARLDTQFGKLVAAIDSLDLWKDSITLFFTDHGEYLGDHGLIEKWPSGLSQTLVREPLLIGGAGLPANHTVAAMTEMVDLVPTLLEFAGIREHFPHNGLSWVPLLRPYRVSPEGTNNDSYCHKKYAFSEGGFLTSEEPLLEQAPYPYDIKAGLQHEDTTLVGKAISVRNHEWTFVYRLYESSELYNRAADPHEMHNLAALPEHSGRVSELEKEVFRWLFETSDALPWVKDPRFPDIDLVSPRDQIEERLRRAGERWEFVCM